MKQIVAEAKDLNELKNSTINPKNSNIVIKNKNTICSKLSMTSGISLKNKKAI